MADKTVYKTRQREELLSFLRTTKEEHVTVNEDTINIEFRTENIKSIQEAYCEQNP